MKSRLFAVSFLLGSFLAAGFSVAAAPRSAELRVASELKIPGATLPAGTYTISVEDRLIDRAIVRIASGAGDNHFLLLAVPSKRLSSSAGDFVYFMADNDSQALRGWDCQGCAAPLEFVYPKSDAVALTGSSGKPVLAMDPSYDKLPANLGPDDMKVVTLWLVKPQAVTADNKGQGVTAAKLADSQDADEANAARSSKKPATGAQVAEVRMPARALPHTASNTFALLAGGLGLFSGALLFRMRCSQRG